MTIELSDIQAALLPCPFCGGAANVDREIFLWESTYRVACSLCTCRLAHEYDTPDESVRAWNHRHAVKFEPLAKLKD